MISEEKWRLILKLVSKGDAIEHVLATLNVDHEAWIDTLQCPDKQRAFTAAEEQGYHILASSLLRVHEECADLGRARLQSDNLKWWLSKRFSKIYGERVQHEHTGTIDLRAAMGSARSRIEARPIRDLKPSEYKQVSGNKRKIKTAAIGRQPVVTKPVEETKSVPNAECSDDDVFK